MLELNGGKENFHGGGCWGLMAGPSGAIYGNKPGGALRGYHSGILAKQ